MINARVRLRFPLIGGMLALVLVALLAVVSLSQARGPELEVFGTAPDFILADQLGRSVRSEELRGRVVIADFIYTQCPDICPLLSAQMQGLQDRLRREGLLGSPVYLLSFTVDPARDTPAVLRAYAERYNADPAVWRFLTGPAAVVTPLITRGFYQAVQALPPQGTPAAGGTEGQSSYEVMHSGRFVLIDREGRVRAYYDGNALDPDRIVRDVRSLVR